jgi:hypothetical protein
MDTDIAGYDFGKVSRSPRFVRWVVDLVTRPFDQAWLDYQYVKDGLW